MANREAGDGGTTIAGAETPKLPEYTDRSAALSGTEIEDASGSTMGTVEQTPRAEVSCALLCDETGDFRMQCCSKRLCEKCAFRSLRVPLIIMKMLTQMMNHVVL